MNTKTNIAKLGRKKSHRESLKKNLLTSLVLYEHLKTTQSKGKALVPLFDDLIKQSKKEKHLAERNVGKALFDQNAVMKVLEVFAERFKDQNSGFIKMFKLGKRKGDNADMVQLFVKGYAYKDIGTEVKKAKKSEKLQKEEKVVKAEKKESAETKKSSKEK